MLERAALVERCEPAPGAVTAASRTLEGLGLTVTRPGQRDFEDSQIVIAVGGDGTMLRAAVFARDLGVPVIGFNAGHMGFLTDADDSDLSSCLGKLINGTFERQERWTIDVTIIHEDGRVDTDWALNEAAVLRTGLAHPADFALGVDGRAVSSYAADGMLLSTSTGSTAYAFSAGGPIIWPDVRAMLVTPLAAHGLFTTPLVLGESSCVQLQVDPGDRSSLQVWCDSLRMISIEQRATIEARISDRPVILARLHDEPFSQRLVSKFQLPISSWRGEA